MEKKIRYVAIAVVVIILVASMAILLTNGQSNNVQAKKLTLQDSIAFGGLSNESFTQCAVSSDGSVYAVGCTDGAVANVSGGYDATYNNELDVLVVKFSSDLSTVVASTYLGGSDRDMGHNIAVSDEGKVYVLGWTRSSDFPTTAGAFNTTNAGELIFVSRLSADLTQLEHSTFLGEGSAAQMALDGQGDVVISGQTESPLFPTTEGAYNRTLIGEDDAFIARLSPDLSILKSSTLFGGPGIDGVYAMQIDNDGSIYIAGATFMGYDPVSGRICVPTTPGAADSTYDGPSEGYVAKFSSDLRELIASTLLGGSSYDSVDGLIITSDGNLVLGGSTHSGDFPMTSDAMSSVHWDPIDAYICKMSSDLTELIYSSYLGIGASYITQMIELPDGDIAFSTTYSDAFTPEAYTTSDAFKSASSGSGSDGYVMILDSKLSTRVYASLIGGSNNDDCVIGLGTDCIYVIGSTSSADFRTLEDTSRETEDHQWVHSDGFALKFKFT